MTCRCAVLSLFFLLLAGLARAQSFTGYNLSSYTGVYSTLINPANILDHRVRADVNLAGITLAEANNIFQLPAGRQPAAVLTTPTGKTGRLSLLADALGPSVMLRLSDRHALALSTRFRVQANANAVSASLLNLSLLEEVSSLNGKAITLPHGSVQVQGWNELAFTYSRQVSISSFGVWKAGASLKLVSGQGAAYLKSNNFEFTYNDSLRTNEALQEAYGGAMQATGSLNLAYAGLMDQWGPGYRYRFFNQPRLAADLGVVYEYRDAMQVYQTTYNPHTLNYKWKAGLSVTDVGSIFYKASPQSAHADFSGQTYVFNDLVLPADSNSLRQAMGYYKTTFGGTRGAPYFTMALPATLHLLFDYSFNSWLSAGAHFYTPLRSEAFTYYTGTHHLTALTITPRAELPWIGAYLPVGYHFAAGFQMGAALRLGPLVAGSATAISSGLLGLGKGIDAYVLLRIPFFGYRAYQPDETPAPAIRLRRQRGKLFGCRW